VIRSNAAKGDQRAPPAPLEVAEYEFELTELVASVRLTGPVVALDPEPLDVYRVTQAGEGLNGRRQAREGNAGEPLADAGEPALKRQRMVDLAHGD
jgi:hypothetical protein